MTPTAEKILSHLESRPNVFIPIRELADMLGIRHRSPLTKYYKELRDAGHDIVTSNKKGEGVKLVSATDPLNRANTAHSVEAVEPQQSDALMLSTVKRCSDNTPARLTTTWPEFVVSLQKPTVRGELSLDEYRKAEKSVRDKQKDGPGLICGTFSKPGTKKKADLVSLSMVAVDLDDGILNYDEVCGRLEGFEAVVHTSYSHHPEKPRLRAYLALSSPVMSDIAATLGRIIDLMNDRLDGHVAPESRNPAQLYYLPAVPPGGEQHYQCRHLTGCMIDPVDFPPIPAVESVQVDTSNTGNRPGDDYNNRSSWDDLLLPIGWKCPHTQDGYTHYTRPGKIHGISLTVFPNKVAYCHTSAPEAAPLQGGTGYTLFTAYTLMHHAGDFKAAAAELVRQGYGEAPQKAAEPVFEADPIPAAPAIRKRTMFISGTDCLQGDVKIDWLIPQYLEAGTTGQMFGPSGVGKSFLALDMGLSVATGKDWNGKPVKQGLVVNFVGEGHAGVLRRVQTWSQHYEIYNLDLIRLSRLTVDLYADEQAVIEEIKEAEQQTGHSCRMILIDTLARHIDGDENSTKDMMAFIKLVDRIRNEFPGSVAIIVHHTGNTETDRARGSSSQKAAYDFEMSVNKGRLTFTKVKDGATPDPITFSLHEVEMDEDEYGDPITSCVVEYGSKATTSQPTGNKLLKGKYAAAAKQALIKACLAHPQLEDGRYQTDMVTWRRFFFDQLHQSEASEKGFERERKAFVDAGHIEITDSEVVPFPQWQCDVLAQIPTTDMSPTITDKVGTYLPTDTDTPL